MARQPLLPPTSLSDRRGATDRPARHRRLARVVVLAAAYGAYLCLCLAFELHTRARFGLRGEPAAWIEELPENSHRQELYRDAARAAMHAWPPYVAYQLVTVVASLGAALWAGAWAARRSRRLTLAEPLFGTSLGALFILGTALWAGALVLLPVHLAPRVAGELRPVPVHPDARPHPAAEPTPRPGAASVDPAAAPHRGADPPAAAAGPP